MVRLMPIAKLTTLNDLLVKFESICQLTVALNQLFIYRGKCYVCKAKHCNLYAVH